MWILGKNKSLACLNKMGLKDKLTPEQWAKRKAKKARKRHKRRVERFGPTAAKFRVGLLKNETLAEKALRYALADKGVEFETQKIFFFSNTFYLADFFFPANGGFCVEIDGASHSSPSAKLKDAKKAKRIYKNYKHHTYRFSDEEVYEDLEKVVSFILNKVRGKQ